MMNKKGYDSFDEVMKRGAIALSLAEFETMATEHNALILDVRHQVDFVKGFVPNSMFIGLNGGFAPWVGALVPDLKQPILLIAPEGKEEEAVTRLSRVGFDHTLGYLKGGVQAWQAAGKELDTIHSIDVPTFQELHNADPSIKVLDVRKPGEHDNSHIVNSENSPLDFIQNNMNEIDKNTTYHIHCAGGYRSTIASSILKANGYENLINVQVRYSELVAAGLPVEEVVCSKG